MLVVVCAIHPSIHSTPRGCPSWPPGLVTVYKRSQQRWAQGSCPTGPLILFDRKCSSGPFDVVT